MGIVIINALVLCIDDNRGTEGGIQVFAELHVYLLGRSAQHGVFRGVGTQQDSVCAGDGGK